jgi:ATP-binding cassette, subfamily B, bacterial PglK
MISLIKKLNDILSPKDKLKLAIIFLLMLIAGFTEALSIGIVAGFVAVVADPNVLFEIEYLKKPIDFLGVNTSRDILVYGTFLLIGIFLIKNSYLAFYKYIKARFIYNRYRLISTRLFSIYMNVPYSFHLRRNSADLIRNINTETRFLATFVMLPILEIATEAIMALGILILLFAVEPVVTLAALALLGGTSALFLKVTKNRIHKHGQRTLEERAGIIKVVSEGIGGFKDATIMNRQRWFVNKFKRSINSLSNAEIFRETTKQSVKPAMETIAVIGMLLVAMFLLQQGYSVAALVSILALFALSIQRLLPALNNIISQYTSLRYHAYAADPIHQDLTSLKDQVGKLAEDEEERIHLKEKIEVKDLTYVYPKSKEEVLKDISLTIPKGKAVGFAGATGSGKTTLVDLILGLLTPTKGNVCVDGKDIKNNILTWQRNSGYIPQFIYLFDDTIKNNIAFGLTEEEIDNEKLQEAIRVAQLDDFIKRLPEGVDTFIGERGIRLSGGQRQRVGIARALYNNPEVLVMDEATSALDNITERFLIQAIEKLRQDRTMIIVAHRLTTVKNCDKIYFLEEGKIIAEGRYEELLESSAQFKEMAREG